MQHVKFFILTYFVFEAQSKHFYMLNFYDFLPSHFLTMYNSTKRCILYNVYALYARLITMVQELFCQVQTMYNFTQMTYNCQQLVFILYSFHKLKCTIYTFFIKTYFTAFLRTTISLRIYPLKCEIFGSRKVLTKIFVSVEIWKKHIFEKKLYVMKEWG